ncbi:MAG: hypothetical protein WA485_25940 [Candidatus Sulfotelmatobacter sp.]
MAQKKKPSERQRRLIEFWLQRPANERTRDHVLVFYGWLEENHPNLLGRGHGDPYQHLQADLGAHIR